MQVEGTALSTRSISPMIMTGPFRIHLMDFGYIYEYDHNEITAETWIPS